MRLDNASTVNSTVSVVLSSWLVGMDFQVPLEKRCPVTRAAMQASVNMAAVGDTLASEKTKCWVDA